MTLPVWPAIPAVGFRPDAVAGMMSGRSTPEDLHVANIKSQIKRNRQNEKRRERNKATKSELKTRIKNVAAAGDDGGEALRLAVKRIDKAATKGVIHKNAAARRKSRLMRAG